MLKLIPNEEIINSNNELVTTVGHIIVENGTSIYFKRIFFNEENDYGDIHIVIIHEILSYHGDHLRFANELVRVGQGQISVSLMDLRGHGLSGGSRAHIDSFDDYVKDTRDLIMQFKENMGSKVSTTVIGMGTGSIVVSKLLIDTTNIKEIDSGILIFPSFCRNKYLNPLKKVIDSVSAIGRIRVNNIINHKLPLKKFDHQSVSLNMLSEMSQVTQNILRSGYYVSSKVLMISEQLPKDSEVNIFIKQIDSSLVKQIIYKKNAQNEDIIVNDVYDWCNNIVREERV